MKKLSLATLVLLLSISAMGKAKYNSGKYSVDPMHSKVGFEISHLVISTIDGTFSVFDGTIELKKKFSSSTVSAKVNIDSINTGVVKRDTHLKSKDFFNLKKHPTMTFKSTKITGSQKSFKLTGDLTIKGIKKSVVFKGKFLGSVKDAWGNQKTAFKATTKIKRKEFGLTWSKLVEAGPVVGDELTITLKIQATKNK